MSENITYRMADLCKMFGVHRNTIRNKCKKYAFLWKNGKYKTVYSAEDVEIIKKALTS